MLTVTLPGGDPPSPVAFPTVEHKTLSQPSHPGTARSRGPCSSRHPLGCEGHGQRNRTAALWAAFRWPETFTVIAVCSRRIRR